MKMKRFRALLDSGVPHSVAECEQACLRDMLETVRSPKRRAEIRQRLRQISREAAALQKARVVRADPAAEAIARKFASFLSVFATAAKQRPGQPVIVHVNLLKKKL